MSKTAVISAALLFFAFELPAETLTLRPGGSVRLPFDAEGFVPTLRMDGTDLTAMGRTAATEKGVAYDFVRSGKVWARGRATLEKTETGARATWRFTFTRPAETAVAGLCCALDVGKFDRASFEVPEKGDVRIRTLTMRPPTEACNSFFDGRWSYPFHSAYLIRTRMPKRTKAKKGDSAEFSVDFSSSVPLSVAASGLYVAGTETGWVRMDHRKNILSGSALDFSTQGLQDAPAGKYGWLKFADNVATFEKRPGVSQRFSGVNFCGEANYPKTVEEAENRAERLRRLGYNALRIHHHDRFLARYENGRLVPNDEYFDRLDRLVDACVRRGIYLTTDLYVSRRVNWKDIGVDRPGKIPMKTWQMVTERGWQDWCDFARIFLSHRNPYTGRTYAEEPALPYLCIQNETAFSNFRSLPELAALWHEFLTAARAKDAKAFPGFSPDALPPNGLWWDANETTAVKSAFWAFLERRFVTRATRFLREELGVKALLTADNYGPTPAFVQEMRDEVYGYSDYHLYATAWWEWLGNQGYSLPVKMKELNPLQSESAPSEGTAFARIWGHPFCVSEWDFVGTSSHRSLGGLLFGSVASVQGWNGIWRFAYDHGDKCFADNVGQPELYNLSRDPMKLASDRATTLLYLRGDMPQARSALALDFGDRELDPTLDHTYLSAPKWVRSGVSLSERVGVSIRGRNVPVGAKVLAQADVNGLKKAPVEIAPSPYVDMDRIAGSLIVKTLRTAGVFAPTAGTYAAGAAVFSPDGPATLFASALTGADVATSDRILVTHLTDALGEGATYQDDARHIVFSRGKAETDASGNKTHLVVLKKGTAVVRLRLARPQGYTVYALGSDGRRERTVPSCVEKDELVFTASVEQPFGGCLSYEVVRESDDSATDVRHVVRQIAEQFLSTEPEAYCPKGFSGINGYPERKAFGTYVHYSTVILWMNALECARQIGDKDLERRLLAKFEPFYGEKAKMIPVYKHVDHCVFGSVPLEVAILTGDSRARAIGLKLADGQWEKPQPDDPTPKQNKKSYEERLDWWQKGYSDQTRLWIDDGYMISLLQTQAYRVTGDQKYLDRAAKELVLYLDRLQLENGLFHHATGVPFCWGRGNGWMVGAMALMLKNLPESHPDRARILKSFRLMCATLLKYQRPDGLWGQVIDDEGFWPETSCSAMFASGFALGARRGWLSSEYAAAAERTWWALVAKMDAYGNLPDTCIGTEAKDSRDHYMKRVRVNGDPHGQAAMLWLAGALGEKVARPEEVTTVTEGAEWVAISNLHEIVAGSALDFSGLGLQDAPAGKYGWVKSVNGHAEFEKKPGVAARFYGVNLCNSANYLSDEEIERLTDRLVRLGYNSIRIHHHDDMWSKDTDGARDKLDRLVAACIRKGLYLTTDLNVSRKCTHRELGIDKDGLAKYAKQRMMSSDAAFENWKNYAKDFMTHVNPYTGRSLADEPAMPFIVLLNESSPHSDWKRMKELPELQSLWKTWLAELRAKVPGAYPEADPEKFPAKGGWWDPGKEADITGAFWAWCMERFSAKAAKYLRDELGVKALLATENNGPVLPVILKARATAGDYCDFHWYTEHAGPVSKEQRKELGVKAVGQFHNKNVLAYCRKPYRSTAFNRVWGRPQAVSESNMGGPNMYRALHGLVAGTFAAVQDWSCIWTFALGHSKEKLFDGHPAPPGRFDLALDPVLQATDRLAPLLFLRGDQVTPTAAYANVFTPEAMDPADDKMLSSRPKWIGRGLEWRARLGVAFGEPLPSGVEPVLAYPPAEPKGDPPSVGVFVDEKTGEMTVSGKRTVGCYVEKDHTLSAGPLTAQVSGHRALVAATSLGADEVSQAPRLLVWHVTDAHGEGFAWGGTCSSPTGPRVGIVHWGKGTKVLAHVGKAAISLALARPEDYDVWALDTVGNRKERVATTVTDGKLCFTAEIRPPEARFYYEVVRK